MIQSVSAPHQNSGSFKVHPNTQLLLKEGTGTLETTNEWSQGSLWNISNKWIFITPVFLTGKSQGQRRLQAAVHGVAKSQTRQQLNNNRTYILEYPFLVQVYSRHKYKTLCQFHLRESRARGSPRSGFGGGAKPWHSAHRQPHGLLFGKETCEAANPDHAHMCSWKWAKISSFNSSLKYPHTKEDIFSRLPIKSSFLHFLLDTWMEKSSCDLPNGEVRWVRQGFKVP